MRIGEKNVFGFYLLFSLFFFFPTFLTFPTFSIFPTFSYFSYFSYFSKLSPYLYFSYFCLYSLLFLLFLQISLKLNVFEIVSSMVITIGRTFNQTFVWTNGSGCLEMVGKDIQTHSHTKGHKET